MLIIGERINSSRKGVFQAIQDGNTPFIQAEAIAQDKSGADYIDVNAGTFVGEESQYLRWVIECVQDVTDKPLCIDSADPEVIKAMLPLVKKPPMINSISLEPDRLGKILPLVVEYNAKVIALCQTQDKMAQTADDKIRMSEQLVDHVTTAGLPLHDLYIDPLVYPISTNAVSAVETLNAIERIMTAFPDIHTTCGLTNVSYGLPARKLVNRCFLVAALGRGLDAVILDPTDPQLLGALKGSLMLMGKDDYCMSFITAFREGRISDESAPR